MALQHSEKLLALDRFQKWSPATGQARPFERIDYNLKKIVDEIFIPGLSMGSYEILYNFTNLFLNISSALRRAGQNPFTSYHRRSIDPHEEDKYHRGPEQFLLNTLRDLWNSLLENDKECAAKVYQLWKRINDDGLERLSLYTAKKLLESDHD